MEFLVAYSEFVRAERLNDIEGTADIHCGNKFTWIPGYKIILEEIVKIASQGEQFKVATFANKLRTPSFVVDGWKDCSCWPRMMRNIIKNV